jgi:hypothetical protein
MAHIVAHPARMAEEPPREQPVSSETSDRSSVQQLRANVEAQHANLYPDGCPMGCESCLVRVRLPEARAMLEGRSKLMPTLDHLRALWLHHLLMTRGR